MIKRSRRKALQNIASYIGNAAAHIALYKDFLFTMKEAISYFSQAAEIAGERTWNEAEIKRLSDLSTRRAARVIRARLEPERKKEFDNLLDRAREEITKFIEAEMP